MPAKVTPSGNQKPIQVFLDPDGTIGIGLGLMVVVCKQTGIRYGSQCGGNSTTERWVEGFLIPVGGETDARRVKDWFWERFRGNCYQGGASWNADWLSELATMVSSIPIWVHSKDADKRSWLTLDTSRMDECIEAWIPVDTPHGKGYLLLANSD